MSLNDWFFLGLSQMQPIPIEQVRTHKPGRCNGERCSIHNPSDHPLKDAPQVWRPDRGIVERMCPHGIGHPDPDDLTVREEPGGFVHGCDGCCRA